MSVGQRAPLDKGRVLHIIRLACLFYIMRHVHNLIRSTGWRLRLNPSPPRRLRTSPLCYRAVLEKRRYNPRLLYRGRQS